MMNNVAKSFDILAAWSQLEHPNYFDNYIDYFDNPTKLLSDLYLAKFSDIFTKRFFVFCIIIMLKL